MSAQIQELTIIFDEILRMLLQFCIKVTIGKYKILIINFFLQLKKQYVNANKEKESMVMKYALNEREIIIQKKHREESEKKMKNALKERDDAVNKSKNAIAEKLKLQQLADSRVSKHFQNRLCFLN